MVLYKQNLLRNHRRPALAYSHSKPLEARFLQWRYRLLLPLQNRTQFLIDFWVALS